MSPELQSRTRLQFPNLKKPTFKVCCDFLVDFGGGAAPGARNPQKNAQDVSKQHMSALPPNAQFTLRQALAGVTALAIRENGRGGHAAPREDLAIEFALDRFNAAKFA